MSKNRTPSVILQTVILSPDRFSGLLESSICQQMYSWRDSAKGKRAFELSDQEKIGILFCFGCELSIRTTKNGRFFVESVYRCSIEDGPDGFVVKQEEPKTTRV